MAFIESLWLYYCCIGFGFGFCCVSAASPHFMNLVFHFPRHEQFFSSLSRWTYTSSNCSRKPAMFCILPYVWRLITYHRAANELAMGNRLICLPFSYMLSTMKPKDSSLYIYFIEYSRLSFHSVRRILLLSQYNIAPFCSIHSFFLIAFLRL